MILFKLVIVKLSASINKINVVLMLLQLRQRLEFKFRIKSA